MLFRSVGGGPVVVEAQIQARRTDPFELEPADGWAVAVHYHSSGAAAEALSGEHRDVLDTYRKFAEDRGWLRRIREAIDTGLTAEAAVQRVGDDMRARFAQISDPYLRERLLDVDDVNNRLLMHLTGKQVTAEDLRAALERYTAQPPVAGDL